MESCPKPTEAQLKKIFETLDDDKSGKICVKELKRGFEAAGVSVTDTEMKEIIKCIDKSGDGQVDWPEFKTFFESF
uniref:calhepatin-like n=1 Tax=Myxine glutinosa TaxID=7769 RepID=UPI00358F2030